MRTSASLQQLIGAPMPIQDFLGLAVRAAGELAALHGRGAPHGFSPRATPTTSPS